MTKKIKPGTVRYTNSRGNIVWSVPGQASYSTAVFIAEQMYDGKEWQEVNENVHTENRPS